MKTAVWLIISMITGTLAEEVDGIGGWILLIACFVSVINAIVCLIGGIKKSDSSTKSEVKIINPPNTSYTLSNTPDFTQTQPTIQSRKLSAKFCHHCGAKVEKDDIFCVECGNKLRITE